MARIPQYEPELRKKWLIAILDILADPLIDAETLERVCRSEAIPYVWRWQEDMESNSPELVALALNKATNNVLGLLENVIERYDLPKVEVAHPKAPAEAIPERAKLFLENERKLAAQSSESMDGPSADCSGTLVDDTHFEDEVFARHAVCAQPDLFWRSAFINSQARKRTIGDDHKVINQRFRCLRSQDSLICNSALFFLFYAADGSGGAIFDLKKGLDFSRLGRVACSLLHVIDTDVCVNATRVLAQVVGASEYFPPISIPKLLSSMATNVPCDNGSSVKAGSYRLVDFLNGTCSGATVISMLDRNDTNEDITLDSSSLTPEALQNISLLDLCKLRVKLVSNDATQRSNLVALQAYALSTLIVLLSDFGFDKVILSRCPNALNAIVDVCRSHPDVQVNNSIKTNIVESLTIFLSFVGVTSNQKYFKRLQLAPLLNDIYTRDFDENYFEQLCDLASFAPSQTGIHPLKLIDLSVDTAFSCEARMRSLDVLLRTFDPSPYENSVVSQELVEPTFNALFDSFERDLQDLLEHQKKNATLLAGDFKTTDIDSLFKGPFDPERLHQRVTERLDLLRIFLEPLTWDNLEKTALKSRLINHLIFILCNYCTLESLPTRAVNSAVEIIDILCRSRQARILVMNELNLKNQLFDAIVNMSRVQNRSQGLLGAIQVLHDCLWGHDAPSDRMDDGEDDGNEIKLEHDGPASDELYENEEENNAKYGFSTRFYDPEADGTNADNNSEIPRHSSPTELFKNRNLGRIDRLHMRIATELVVDSFCMGMPSLLFELDEVSVNRNFQKILSIIRATSAYFVPCFYRWVLKILKCYVITRTNRQIISAGIKELLLSASEKLYEGNAIGECILRHYILTGSLMMLRFIQHSNKIPTKFDLSDIHKLTVETAIESNSPLPIWRMMEFLGLSNSESICAPPALQMLRNSLVERLIQPELDWDRNKSKAWHLLLKFSSSNELIPVVRRISQIFNVNDINQLSQLARLALEIMDLGLNEKLAELVLDFLANVLSQIEGAKFGYLEPRDSSFAQLILKASQLDFAKPEIQERVALLKQICLQKTGIAASRLLDLPFSSLLEEGDPFEYLYTAASAVVSSSENESHLDFLCSMLCSSASEQHLDILVQCLEIALKKAVTSVVNHKDRETCFLCIRMLARHLSFNPKLESSKHYLGMLVHWLQTTFKAISRNYLSLQALAALEELLKSIINVQAAVLVPHAENTEGSDADIREKFAMAAGGIIRSLPSTSSISEFFTASNDFFRSMLRTSNSSDPKTPTVEILEEAEQQLALQCLNSVIIMLVQSRWELASTVINCGIIHRLLDFNPKLSGRTVNELQKVLTNIFHVITTSPRISASMLIELLNNRANYKLSRALNSELDLDGIIMPAHALVLRKPELRELANDCYFISPDGNFIQRHIVEESALACGVRLDTPDSFNLTNYDDLSQIHRERLIVELTSNFLNAESPKQAEICTVILIDQMEISGRAREAIMKHCPKFTENLLVQFGSQNLTEFTQKIFKPHAKNLLGLVVRLLDKFTCKSKDEHFSQKVSSSLEKATRFVMKGVLLVLEKHVLNYTQPSEVAVATLHLCCDVVQSIWGDSEKLKSNLLFAQTNGNRREVPELYFRKVIRELKVIEALFGTFAMYGFDWNELRDLKMCSLIFLDRIIFQELFRIEGAPVDMSNRPKKLRLENRVASEFANQTTPGNELDEFEVEGYENGDESEDHLHTDLVEERRSQHHQRTENSHGNIFRNSSLGEYESSSSDSAASGDEGFDELGETEEIHMIDDDEAQGQPFGVNVGEESASGTAMSASENTSERSESDETQLEVMLVLSEDDSESMESEDFPDSGEDCSQFEGEFDEYISDENDRSSYYSESDTDGAEEGITEGHHEIQVEEYSMPVSISRFGDDLFLLYNTLNDFDRDHPALFRGSEKIDYFRLAFEHPKPVNLHMSTLQARAHVGSSLIEENCNDIWCCPSDQRDESVNMAPVIIDIVSGMKETAIGSKERYFENDQTYKRVFENLSTSIGLQFTPKTDGSNQSSFIPQLLAMLARICFAETFEIELDLLTHSLLTLAGIPSGRQLFSTLIHILFEASCGHIDTIYASLTRILASSSPFPMNSSLLATRPPESANAALVCRNILLLLNIFFGAEPIRENRAFLLNKFNKELCEWHDCDIEYIKIISAMAKSCVKRQGATLLGLITKPVISRNRVLLEQASSFVEKIISATNDSWNPLDPPQFSDPEDVDADSENRRGSGSKDLSIEVNTVTASRMIHVLSSGECNYRIFRNIVDVVKKNTAVENFSNPLLKSLRRSKYKLLANLKRLGNGMKERVAIADLRERYDLLQDTMKFLRLINVAGNLFKEHERISLFQKLEIISLWRMTAQFVEFVQHKEGITPEFTLSLLEIITMPAEIVLRENSSVIKSNESCLEEETASTSALASLTEEQEVFFEEVTQFLRSFMPKHSVPINELIRLKPKLVAGPLGSIALKFRAVDFENKFEWLSQEISHLRDFKYSKDQQSCVISRENIFEDSLELISNFEPHELLYPISIEFEGEPGIDDGGVSREWYEVLSREILNPMYGLFKAAAPGSSMFQINPLAEGNPDKEAIFRFVGRFLGRAVYDQYTIGLYFSRVVYKYFLGEPISLSDMEVVDEEYYKSLKWMLENDITDVFYETFSVESDNFGAQKIVDLIPGGRDIAVDESNKEEYVRLIVEYKLVLSVKSCLDSMTQGLYEVLFKSWVQAFTDKELELVFCGLPTIDIDDWCRNTEYHGYSSHSRQVRWFWLAVRSFSTELRAKLLQFSTGTSRVPAQGFGNLDSNTDSGNFIIEREKGSTDRLPSAHTCMNQINIPEYESYSKLRKLLLKAITEGNEGFGFV